MADNPLVIIAKETAAKYDLDGPLVCAIIEQESNWDTWAIRYEPAFMARYVSPLYTNNKITATEAWSRSFSWGPMQTMGQVARENGYEGPLARLCEFATGVDVGCRVFKRKLDKAKGDVTAALLAWNGGAFKEYAAQVLARVAHYR